MANNFKKVPRVKMTLQERLKLKREINRTISHSYFDYKKKFR